MRKAWMAMVCLMLGCQVSVPESGSESGGGGAAGAEDGGGGEGGAKVGGDGGGGAGGGTGGANETIALPLPLVFCGPAVAAAPELICYGDTQCDDNDDCTADRCAPDGRCCHSVVGNCH